MKLEWKDQQFSWIFIDEESNPISIGTRILGIKNSEKSGKRFPLKILS